MWGRLRGVAWCLVVCLGARGSAYLPWARFGGGGGAVLAGLSAVRGATYTCGAPAAVGRGAGWRSRLGCDACAGGRVGVAALGRVARARRHTMAGVDKSSVAAASHTLAAVASTAMITMEQTHPLRRHRALQHGRPTRASYWRTPHAHAHCLELHVILLSFACTHACLAQTLYSRRILLHASIRDTKLAHALKRFRLPRDHTATKTCMCLPRTLTQSLYTPKSLFSRTQPIPYP